MANKESGLINTKRVPNDITVIETVAMCSLQVHDVENGKNEIYMYKDCIAKSQQGGMFSMFSGKEQMNTENNCQQTSIVLNKRTGIVKKVSYFPYPNKE